MNSENYTSEEIRTKNDWIANTYNDGYNSGINTAISLVKETLGNSYPELLETLVCGLECCKK